MGSPITHTARLPCSWFAHGAATETPLEADSLPGNEADTVSNPHILIDAGH